MYDRPPISICQLAFPNTTFREDVELCLELGLTGISIDERKLDRDDTPTPEEFRESGLKAVICSPAVLTTLPSPRFATPPDLHDRQRSIEEFIRKVAPYEPAGILICPGPAGELSDEEAGKRLADTLLPLAAVARESGTVLSIEPMRAERRDTWSFINSIEEAAGFIDTHGLDAEITVDTWHVWDSPAVEDQLERYVSEISGIQVADYQHSESVWDRLLPGQGLANIPRLFSVLAQAGFRGWLDIEIFSESLWKLPPYEFLRQATQATIACWEQGLALSGK